MSNVVQVPASPANYTVGRLGYKVAGVVIHTIVGTLGAADATFANPNRGASAHYGVACDGSVCHQYVSEANIAWHCGRFYPDATHPLGNANTVGIEHCDNGQPFAPRSEAEYGCSAQLVYEICRRYGIPIDRSHIRMHREVSVNPTACPGTLDIDRIVRQAAALATPQPEGDDDMLYTGPFHAKTATFKTFTAGKSYLDPSVQARVGGVLVVGASVTVDGYRYSDSPVTSPDLNPAAGSQPGPDYVWWHATTGQWVPDAFLDTSSLAGAPAAALPATEALANYFAVAGTVGPPAPPPDLSAYATKADLAATEAKIPTKATGNVSLTLSK